MENLYLAHHGIKGMKWGVRRYQDENGRLTPEGKKKYSKRIARLEKKIDKRFANKADIDARSATIAKFLTDRAERDHEFYSGSKLRTRYYQKHRDSILKRYEDKYDYEVARIKKDRLKNEQKTMKLLDDAKKLGVDRIASSTVRRGRAVFYGGDYEYIYKMPVESLRIRLE